MRNHPEVAVSCNLKLWLSSHTLTMGRKRKASPERQNARKQSKDRHYYR